MCSHSRSRSPLPQAASKIGERLFPGPGRVHTPLTIAGVPGAGADLTCTYGWTRKNRLPSRWIPMNVTRGFTGRPRVPDPGLPPGQYDAGDDWPVLSAEVTPELAATDWTFRVDGLVKRPLTWDW